MDNKQKALVFLDMIVSGQIEEAYEKYVDMNGSHHNLFFPPSFLSLQKGMKENQTQFPNKKIEVKHAVAEGDMVITHSHLTLAEGTTEMVVVHIFRFADGKIVELWDCGQPIPADSPNKNNAF